MTRGDDNPHAHILLTMRAMDEKSRWLPKSRKVYDLDENRERIRQEQAGKQKPPRTQKQQNMEL